MNVKHILATLALSLSVTAGAQAALLQGQDVRFTYYRYLDSVDPNALNGVKRVGDGVEVPFLLDGVAQLDISDNNLLITFIPVAPEDALFVDSTGNIFYDAADGFNGFEIFDVYGLIDAFTSVTINPISNLPGFTQSLITFDADHIWVNWQGLFFDRDRTILSLDITGNSQPIPEPDTIPLLGISTLAFMIAWRHRIKRS